jgi:hypothetical protein
MKIFIRLLGLGLLLLGQPRLLSAQEAPAPPCHDVLHLRDGSQLRGQIQATKDDGKTLVFRTWSGVELDIPRVEVTRILQRCNDRSLKTYHFKETGWFHNTRLGLLIGQSYYGDSRIGLQLQHSSGWMFSRVAGIGLGSGIDIFDAQGNEPAMYPVFAEVRGYLQPRRITPFYALAGGWAFSGKNSTSDWGWNESWKGGWMAQATVGYRIGNNVTIQVGIRLQHRQREWSSNGWGTDSGTDQILHKRVMAGVGLLL